MWARPPWSSLRRPLRVTYPFLSGLGSRRVRRLTKSQAESMANAKHMQFVEQFVE
ncbi:hypothetical protein JD844_019063 [Phrynosoma platyrhinos]|uniref:Uncharacterized protein n=1 Tax=Phrynosoma platyrhinos TaxID=52577 RepID=A0ABQ7SPK4_PHRPL|nr:hypothetical protein JD844_019063 [Phrynosoma platyrhinos]